MSKAFKFNFILSFILLLFLLWQAQSVKWPQTMMLAFNYEKQIPHIKGSQIQSEINSSDLPRAACWTKWTTQVFPAYIHMLHGGGEEHVKLHTNAKPATTFPCHFSGMHDKRAVSSWGSLCSF